MRTSASPGLFAGFSRRHLVAALAVIGVAVLVLLAMGRTPICRCGYIKFWHGIVYSSENSQHLTDWYSFSHVLHGFAFYGLLWLIARRWSTGLRMVAAVVTESAWEILENTPFVINRYREVTISLDYFGDSVVNSGMDIVAMALGFLLAARLPVWTTVLLAILTEVLLAWWIRDNLTLNILMLIYPLDAVRGWQGG